MVTQETIKEQIRGSFEIIIVTIGLIIGLIMLLFIVADTIGDRIIEIVNNNYGSRGLFNLGLPDIFWILLALVVVSFIVKLAVSVLMPIVLPFHGYCPRCGVKPLSNETICTECGGNLYRKRISKFDLKIYAITTLGFAVFLVIWYILSMIIGLRPGTDPGI